MPSSLFFQLHSNKYFWPIVFGLLIVLRIFVVAASPLPLGGDEAQYWQWSTTPDWGYFSKPPLIAWLIASTTAIFGDSAFGVRVSLPFLHGLGAWLLWLSARHLWPNRPGAAIWAAGLYLLMPGVFLSSFLMTTDALLLPLAALAIYAFIRAKSAKQPFRWLILLGIALGFGLLAKYAMAFLVVGLAILAILDKDLRQMFVDKWRWTTFLIPIFIISPNIWWNQAHSFATFSHTAANIELNTDYNLYSLWPQIIELGKFWLDQIVVFGPISLFLLLIALGHGVFRKSGSTVFQLTILCLVVFAIISVQALLSRAHANWAVLAYIPGVLVLAHFASTCLRQKLLILGVALQLICGGIGMIVVSFPQKFVHTPAISALKPLIGWQRTKNQIFNEVQSRSTGQGFSAIITDTRLFHYSLAWELRQEPHPPLRMWSRYAWPHSHRELMQPLTSDMKGEFLLIISRPRFQPRVLADFTQTTHLKTVQIELGRGRIRKVELFVASGFSPQIRDQAYEDRWRYLDEA